MRETETGKKIRDLLLTAAVIAAAMGVSLLLARIHDDNNPFAMALFLLAVAVVARFTSGYFWGIAASVMGTFFVNYAFSYPFWSFDISYPGYPLTMAVMLVVSVLISALTTQIKQQEQINLEMEREKMRANLLRAIAHDIRTPLASILGASSALLEQKLSGEDQEKLLSGIHQDAQWLVRITENLLSITRVSGNQLELKKKDEVLEEIIGSAVLKYHKMSGSLPVFVDAPDQILIVPADAVLIEQVLLNLFDNVSTHAEGATGIWLHIRTEKEKVVLSVEDDGVGISKALLPDILNGTVQSDRKQADDRRSMGIGLSVCRTIIMGHGGDLRIVESRHGGTAVVFYLPWKEDLQ